MTATDRLHVVLFPAVLGGGRGDLVDVAEAGDVLARAGYSVATARRTEAPESPRGDRSRRRRRLLTITSDWGVTAAPARRGPYGRAGPWSRAVSEWERRFGSASTLHVSLGEFARTLTSREATIERYREGGFTGPRIAQLVRSRTFSREVARFHREYRRFRSFDRGNVLHLFPTFRYRRSFAGEFPEAVQTGPLWPRPARARRRSRSGVAEWLWYASPASSTQLVPAIERGLLLGGRTRIRVRSPRAISLPRTSRGVVWKPIPSTAAGRWAEQFAGAHLRITTGSRTLLEAVAFGGAFLYFNGLTPSASGPRRHRPEKIRSLLGMWRRAGVSASLCRDLDDFSRGRRVSSIIARARGDPGWSRQFPARPEAVGFRAPFRSVGEVLRTIADEFATGKASSFEVVDAIRRASRGRREFRP